MILTWLQLLLFPYRGRLLLEIGTALLFFGPLASDQALQQFAKTALEELRDRGYRIPTPDHPLRLYPLTGKSAGGHTGLHRPGVIQLRYDVAQRDRTLRALRHELMHEANARTCGGKLARWSDEASALIFAGEAQQHSPSSAELTALQEAIRSDAPLTRPQVDTLRGLLGSYDWPRTPCQVSPALEALLQPQRGQVTAEWLVVHILSGRSYGGSEVGGTDRAPVGSLLKIPYAAALTQISRALRATALAQSDTEKLLSYRNSLNLPLLQRLLEPEGALSRAPLCSGSPCSEREARALLGERSGTGEYPLQHTLREAALLLRRAVLRAPHEYGALASPQLLRHSTVKDLDPATVRFLVEHSIAVKTGTASTAEGRPLYGHVAALWPAGNPKFLFVGRGREVRGATVLEKLFPTLRQVVENLRGREQEVRVQLLAAAPGYELFPHSSCGVFTVAEGTLRGGTYSGCGSFTLTTRAPGAKPSRTVSGLLLRSEKGGQYLVTDEESYADGVLLAEGDALPREAQKALRAVIVMNARYGAHRHPDTQTLCDTTHCMVFQGLKEGAPLAPITEQPLLAILAQRKSSWFPFSLGGSVRWEKSLTLPELSQKLTTAAVLSITRERDRDGAVYFRIQSAEAEERIHCDLLRRRLQLPSCPERVLPERRSIRFSGVGVGHGDGLDVLGAAAAARDGAPAAIILQNAFPVS